MRSKWWLPQSGNHHFLSVKTWHSKTQPCAQILGSILDPLQHDIFFGHFGHFFTFLNFFILFYFFYFFFFLFWPRWLGHTFFWPGRSPTFWPPGQKGAILGPSPGGLDRDWPCLSTLAAAAAAIRSRARGHFLAGLGPDFAIFGEILRRRKIFRAQIGRFLDHQSRARVHTMCVHIRSNLANCLVILVILGQKWGQKIGPIFGPFWRLLTQSVFLKFLFFIFIFFGLFGWRFWVI